MALFPALCSFAADFTMKVTDNGYLDTQGFSVILYQSTFHPIFVDQKNTAMEMILRGQRIATNGDARLVATPEQWDLVAQLKGRHADKQNNRLDAQLSFPSYQMDYRLEVSAEPGGARVSVNLGRPVPGHWRAGRDSTWSSSPPHTWVKPMPRTTGRSASSRGGLRTR